MQYAIEPPDIKIGRAWKRPAMNNKNEDEKTYQKPRNRFQIWHSPHFTPSEVSAQNAFKNQNKCPLTGGTQKASPAAYEQIPGGLSKISSSDETAEIPMLIKNLVAIWRYLAITIAKL